MHDRKMAEAFRTVGLPVLIVGRDGRIEVSNPAANRLFDRALDATPVVVTDIFSGLSKECLERIDATGDGELLKGVSARRPDGRTIDLAVHGTAWSDPDGDPHYTLVLRETGPELARQRAMQADLELNANAVNAAGIAVFEYNPVLDTVEVSDMWRRLLEIEPDEDIDLQKEWRDRVHSDDLPVVLVMVDECIAGTRDRALIEYRLRSRDGARWRWIEVSISCRERDQESRVTGLIGAMADVTERKKLEKELRASISQFRSSFDNAPIGKAIVGLDGRWLRVNPALCTFLGYPEKELLEADFQSVTYPADVDEGILHLARLVRGEEAIYRVEKRYVRADGAIVWGLLNVALVTGANGEPDHFITQIIDVSEQRRLSDLKSSFVSTVSHELRTPLTSILGALTLMDAEDTDQLTPDMRRLLFIARQNGERLHQLVNDILDFEKFSNRKMQISLSLERIAGLAEDAVLTHLHFADKYGVRFTVNCSDRSLAGFVDPGKFQQVMANLLSNAAKFAAKGSVVEIGVHALPDAVRISVSNEGEGIPESFREHIFTPFSQATDAAATNRGGTGLGLNITRQIVEQMGGQIGYESEPGGRTTFWFTVEIESSGS